MPGVLGPGGSQRLLLQPLRGIMYNINVGNLLVCGFGLAFGLHLGYLAAGILVRSLLGG